MGTGITSPQIRDLTIDTADLADAAVTEPKLAAASVTTDKIADLAVTNAKLAGSIATEKLAEGSLFFKDGDTITLQDGSVISTEEQIIVETSTEDVTVDDPEPTLDTDGVAVDGFVRWAVSNTTFSLAILQGWGYIEGFGWVKLRNVVGQVPNGSSLSDMADIRGASRFYMQVTESATSSEGHMLSGVVFQRSSASQVSLIPGGVDGNARVPVSSGANLVQILLTATLVADITVSGAGGLDTGSEAANTGYDIRLITENAGANPALLLTVSGNAATLPGSYTHQSDVLWFAHNNGSSNISVFEDVGQGWCVYTNLDNGIQALTTGVATTATAIDMSDMVPDDGTEARLVYRLNWTGVSGTGSGTLFYQSTAAVINIDNPADNADHEQIAVAIDSGPAASIDYSVSNASDLSMDVWVSGWKLRRN